MLLAGKHAEGHLAAHLVVLELQLLDARRVEEVARNEQVEGKLWDGVCVELPVRNGVLSKTCILLHSGVLVQPVAHAALLLYLAAASY